MNHHVIEPNIPEVNITAATSQSTKQPAQQAPSTVPTQTTATIDKTKYIQIPQHSLVIALEETHKNKDMYNTLEGLAKEGLSMPTPAIFMTHFLNVHRAALSGAQLNYANGNPVPNQPIQDLWQYLSSDFYGGCWTWLNALFKKDGGGRCFITTNLETKTGFDKKKYLDGNQCLLDLPLQENCYANLDFNTQGMPTKKSQDQEYKQGKNIHYWQPKTDRAAGFSTCPGYNGAILFGDRDPHETNHLIGVFACANLGETK